MHNCVSPGELWESLSHPTEMIQSETRQDLAYTVRHTAGIWKRYLYSQHKRYENRKLWLPSYTRITVQVSEACLVVRSAMLGPNTAKYPSRFRLWGKLFSFMKRVYIVKELQEYVSKVSSVIFAFYIYSYICLMFILSTLIIKKNSYEESERFKVTYILKMALTNKRAKWTIT